MKKLITGILFTFLLVFFYSKVFASHVMGIDMMPYECNPNGNNSCEYRFHLNSYYDCFATGSQVPLNPNFIPNANCTGWPLSAAGWIFVSTIEVTPICPTTATLCTWTSATINGVQETYYYADYDFCNMGPGCIYNITYYFASRSNSITSGAAGNNTYAGASYIDPNISPCNNSPVFANKPVPYICLNSSFTFNHGASDPDGDSLSYAIVTCYKNSSTSVDYYAGFSPTAPLGPNCSVSIDPVTGDITLLPTSIEIGVMCVEVTEWRNSMQIGKTIRDMQLTVMNCSNNLPVCLGIDGTGTFQTTICATQQICFTLPTQDGDSLTQSMQYYWNQAITGLSFTNFTQVQVDTLTGVNPEATVCWTPTLADTGSNFFLVTLIDDNCPLLGQNQYTIEIIVEDTATCSNLPINLVDFTVSKVQNIAKIEWNTGMESGVSKYEIERSTNNGKSFNSLSFINAKGNISQGYNYQIQDNNPVQGKNLYRLNLFTTTGIKKIISTKELEFNISEKTVLYPQPVKKGMPVFLKNNSQFTDILELTVTDIAGRLIKKWAVDNSTSLGDLQIDLPNLETGNYVLMVSGSKSRKSFKFQVIQ